MLIFKLFIYFFFFLSFFSSFFFWFTFCLLFKTAHDPYGHTYTSILATIVLSFSPISFYWILIGYYARVYRRMVSIWSRFGVCVMRGTGCNFCIIKPATTLKGIHTYKHPRKQILVVFTHFLLLNLNGTLCWSIVCDGEYLAQMWCLCHERNWL